MRYDPKIKPDGYGNFLGGIDSGLTPNTIGANQTAYAFNVSFRNGWADSRPGFDKRILAFEREECATWFEDNGFQGAGVFKDSIAVSVGGRIFLIDILNGYRTVEITPWLNCASVGGFISPPIGSDLAITVDNATMVQDGYPIIIMDGYYTVVSHTVTSITATNLDATPGVAIPTGTVVKYLNPNSPIQQLAYFLEAEDNLVIQDGQSRAILFSNNSSRRSSESQRELPTGTVMAYGHGRIWLAISDREFIAGDINNGDSSVLRVTENDFLNGGGSFMVPSNAGPIRAMAFIAELDKSLGQGPLQVFTERGVFSVNAPVQREEWQNLANPIQTQTMIDYGAMSHRSTLLINGDIFYRSRDGIRSLIFAVREFGGWGNTPISGEMDGALVYDDEAILKFSSAVVFDNRFLFTVQPHPNGYFCYHQGIGVLDFKPLAGVSRQTSPAWNGVWGGIKPTQLIQGVFGGRERCFAFALNADGKNEMWEISKADSFDNGSGRIESFIDTRSFLFGSLYEAKKLVGLEMWYDNLVGEVDFETFYRPDQYPCWFDWTTWRECQTGRDCSADGGSCYVPTEYKPGYRTRKSVPEPPTVCIPQDNKPSSIGYEFQVRLKWTGKARVKWMMAKAREIEESPNGNIVC